LLYWKLFIANVSVNTPSEHEHVWDVFTNTVGLTHGQSKSSRILAGISTTGQRLKLISKHPIISVTSLDVLFTSLSLLVWVFTRNLDVEAILENSVLSFLLPKHEKHVAFEDDAKRLADLSGKPEPVLETTTPKKRGRPAKNKTAVNGASTSSTGSMRRSTRRGTRSADLDSDTESISAGQDSTSAYQPTSSIKRAVEETEADGVTTGADLVESGESTALALFLAFAGGLGQLAAGALGAEVTGPRE
jgi:hypothetical protein